MLVDIFAWAFLVRGFKLFLSFISCELLCVVDELGEIGFTGTNLLSSDGMLVYFRF